MPTDALSLSPSTRPGTFPSFGAVLFDCDGVLVDSEPITHRVLRAMLEESGWPLTLEECMRIFIGKAVRSEAARIEAETGRPLTDEWMALFYERRNAALAAELEAIAGARQAVEAAHARTSGRIACASGADRHKVELQLSKVGLLPHFQGRVFSGHEMPRTKPAPDVYLAAAAALGVAPARCLVVEDTVTGVTAGVAAGAAVVGYSPAAWGHDAAEALRAAGAFTVIGSMAELPDFLGKAPA
ncbi:HAD family phosphatase [Paracidovorax citrulli]|uniref:HAD-superfamily hydrolase, subfamily IA, variant 3 n=2 Tax=Paracidovorax citrulli TaxID=80869 RepID=A1TVB2_PARC0|nr:HAD family phosphatase [Paracidovorax citrulli]ABM34900.1 HAD-superfamily hydrolase, subfamily IA, variant 3 [Paracidovorax citrulli AAC00-1]ATG96550.1 HAD family phosphatase [Paracidovorax citrulli]PVY64348.1 HAD superfamily hydrolase (TIGR01509 family) [Paracidovorax citrulli]QCX10257.1 6-phosphogluconate phosphatase [Paracidovorax citrulli]REG71452.1 HAD superfamily hydrolase (TIGR01509 family) [Paracidovorax citrulli]